MKVINHQLFYSDDTPVAFRQSPNHGRKIDPIYVVLHFTSGQNVSSAVNWLCDRNSGVSAHLIIGRDGGITQLVKFDTVAWHAGESAWDGRTNLNQYSIGIELDNAGQLRQKGDKWISSSGREYPDDQVYEGVHKHQNKKSGWHKYTDVQISVVREIIKTLFQYYGIKDILGHDDISAVARLDPGPAFPMREFRSKILGPKAGSEPVEEQSKDISPYRIFYSYAHEDEEYKNKLVEHLSILKRRGYILEWHDRMIRAGDNWSKEISKNLESADIILLLVSSAFINSEYCWEKEMWRALERHKMGETTVIPIVLRPVLFSGAPFAELEMLPKDGKPVSKWENEDEAFVNIAGAISDLVVK